MANRTYDYAIIGAGASGLNLALAFFYDDAFKNKKILILEKGPKQENEKTWCFWEKGESKWDKITHHQWSDGSFMAPGLDLQLKLHPYKYKMIRSLDLYNHVQDLLKNDPRFTFEWDTIQSLNPSVNGIEVKGTQNSYHCTHVFDSRPPDLKEINQKYPMVLQHFKGWFINSSTPCFDPDRFVMMDFRLKHEDSTSFMYILPFSKNQGLVEFTLFTPSLIEDQEYDQYLNDYLDEYLQLKEYKIDEIEKGIIPMTTYPFHQAHTEKITKIGTAGGWVRASSGYSFKNSERFAKQIIDNIKTGKPPSSKIATGRFQFYDSLFLDILENRNSLGERIFTDMYKKNQVQDIFKFLDGETTLPEELSIISKLPIKPFTKALIKKTF